MRSRWCHLVGLSLLGVATLALGGCIAELAAPELLGGEMAAGAAEFGAAELAGAEITAAELAELEGAEGLAAGGLRIRAGLLRPALQLRASGAPLTIEMSGAIRQAGRYLATLESDGFLVVERGAGERLLVGKIEDGSIWQAARGGGYEPVGRLRGFVPGRGIRLRSAPSPFSPAVEILRPNVTAEVVNYRGGWFEVRLLSGERGYVWSPFVALAMVLGAGEQATQTPIQGDAGDCPALTTGRFMPGKIVDSNEGAVGFAVSQGERLVVDRELCLSSNSPVATSAWDWSRHSSQALLSNGGVLYANARDVEPEAEILELANGTRIVIDPSIIRSFVEPATMQVPLPGTSLASSRRPDVSHSEPANWYPTPATARTQDEFGQTRFDGDQRGLTELRQRRQRDSVLVHRDISSELGDARSDRQAPITDPLGETAAWAPNRQWIRWVNRHHVDLFYCQERLDVVHQMAARLHKLGATVVLTACRDRGGRTFDTVSYPANQPELADALQNAMRGLKELNSSLGVNKVRAKSGYARNRSICSRCPSMWLSRRRV